MMQQRSEQREKRPARLGVSSSSHDKVGTLDLKHAKLGAEWMLQMAGKHWQPDLNIEGAIKEWLRRWCGYVREAPISLVGLVPGID
jgi:hypothetical protein